MLQPQKALAIPIDATTFPPAGNYPTIASLINTLIPNILIVSGILFFIMFIYAGLQLIAMGQMDPQKWEKTRMTMTGAIIGLIIVVIAYWVVIIIGKVTGVDTTGSNL